MLWIDINESEEGGGHISAVVWVVQVGDTQSLEIWAYFPFLCI